MDNYDELVRVIVIMSRWEMIVNITVIE